MLEKTDRLLHAFAALADLGQEIADAQNFEEMARASLYVVLGALAIRRGALAIYDPNLERLRFVAARGLQSELAEEALDRETASRLGDGPTRGIWLAKARDLPALKALAAARFELLMPLVVRGELIGLLLLGDKASGEPLRDGDREIIAAMARHIAVGIHNHRLMAEVRCRADENRKLYDDLRELYHDTVRAFAVAIDCKDAYTRGHSERVGKYAAIIARELGWDDDAVEGIRVAGYLHDIGKLIVDREVMNSPRRFSARDVPELREHTIAGYEILTRIKHPYTDLPLLARYHHERLDGTGYPEGLQGDQIPLGAKIVALADAFDAMTTDRPYRKRRHFTEIIAELRRCTGTQFACDVVSALCRALLREVDEALRSGERRKIFDELEWDYIQPEHTRPLLEALLTEAHLPPQFNAPSGLAWGIE
ncbi:HD-GYP domain-containing protein [Pyrinomonas methylaliphatogenes]|uniref:Uncharacterized domain HDIG-containing protein n=1 Tax=Pyrinomonas methylaliphatogenes TaxID=454194 RepID=A0A0B6WX12_9BACT|nr:HD domain-containing phosphohydrolase [Pyrinomonas methylaliphatogenes]MBX5478298.1 HD domain-containing protein [Pyrinomonas methylaliphatogenes]CDM65287.1 uncharacterized domain HDIG-containing protein [Pyrinomonas methylaliphatogenes]